MKRKMSMYRTFKTAIFGEVTTKDGTAVPAAKVVKDETNGIRLIINDECCDLRPARDRYNSEIHTISKQKPRQTAPIML